MSRSPSAASSSLADWIRTRGGVVHEALDLCAECADRGRGVIALRAIAKGEPLLRIPRDCALTARAKASTVRVEEKLPDTAAFRALSPYIRSAVALLRERLRGDASEWAPVLASFPETFDLARSWSESELAELEGTSTSELMRLGGSAAGKGGAVEIVWRADIAPLLALPEHREEWPGADLASFRWACDCTTSRGFDDEFTGEGGYGSNFRVISSSFWFEGPYLLPAVDMLNHDPVSPCTTLTVDDEGSFTMTAERAIAKGEEVCHRYQDLPDTRLLMTYGFTLGELGGDTNEIPAAPRITLDALIEECEKLASSEGAFPWDNAMEGWERKLALVRSLLPGDNPAMAVTAADPLPATLRTAALILLAPPIALPEFEGARAANAGRVPLLDSFALGDPDVAHPFVHAIHQCVDAKLALFPSGVREDAMRLDAGETDDPRGRRRMAVLMRFEEQQVLWLTKKKAVTLVAAELAAARAEEEEEEEEEEPPLKRVKAAAEE